MFVFFFIYIVIVVIAVFLFFGVFFRYFVCLDLIHYFICIVGTSGLFSLGINFNDNNDSSSMCISKTKLIHVQFVMMIVYDDGHHHHGDARNDDYGD